MELTEALQPGENKLEVSVQDFTDENQYSRGKQKTKRGGIWYSPQSGIWQSVWLESTPVEFLEKVRITPDYDGAAVHFEFFGTDHVRTRIYDGETLVADTTDTDVPLPDFKSWSPESPFLYQVEFEACGEVIRSYFGMRKFSVGRDLDGLPRLFLNNKPYFHNGLLDQGYYPDGFLTPPANAAMAYDVTHVKRCGFNMLRKHIKMEPLLWYHYCDVQGILVWQDMINGGGHYGLEISAIPFVGITLDDRKYKTFKHPCGDSDVISKHIYFTPIRVHAGDKPWLLTEFGGYALKTPGHTWNERTFGYRVYPSKEKLTAAYQKLFNKVIIPQIKTGLAATVYTQVTDVEDEINGLMTYDRQVAKIDPAVLQKINEKVKY